MTVVAFRKGSVKGSGPAAKEPSRTRAQGVCGRYALSMDLPHHTPLEETLLHALSATMLTLAIVRWIPIALAIALVGLVSGSSVLSAVRRRRDRARRRRSADALIATLQDDRIPDSLRWRGDELTDSARRCELARQLHMFARMAGERVLITAIPVSLSTLRPNHDRLEAVAAVVDDVERPVTARGIVMLEALLDDATRSPLYRPAHGDELGRALASVVAALAERSSAAEGAPQDGSTSRYPAPDSVRM